MRTTAQPDRRPRALPAKLLAALLLCGGVVATVGSAGCVRKSLGRGSEVPMGSWPAWQDLSPLIEVAEAHVDKNALAALEQARELLREGKARSADEALAAAASTSGRHWIAVARADLAALHFTTCIRGVAWRLPDEPGPHARSVDYDPRTKVAPGDLSVEALLTNLDDAIEAGKSSPALATQARIARVRVTGFAASCPANPEVEKRASAIMNSDLATLAAENHLTPDLAYMWAGVQLQTYSGAAARPFLYQAREGGFDDPSVAYMLAAIAYEEGELDTAETLAADAASRYAELGDAAQQAQVSALRGEIALAGRRFEAAEEHFELAIELLPDHTGAMLGLAELERERSGALVASERLAKLIAGLTRGAEELDERAALEMVDELESLVIIANAGDIELAQITRDALLLAIEDEPDPFRRGLRYFYAAALEVRLGEYDSARGHAVTAGIEFDETWVPVPAKADPRAFLDRLAEATP
jgi:tetratricopeptide (TPR) repeat protein